MKNSTIQFIHVLNAMQTSPSTRHSVDFVEHIRKSIIFDNKYPHNITKVTHKQQTKPTKKKPELLSFVNKIMQIYINFVQRIVLYFVI